MTIRFQCGSCSQPIEVDDELASKVVGCPYCRNTVTAPTESTLAQPDRIPVASPLDASGGTFQAASTPPTGYAGAQAQSNPLAIVAFVSACAVFVLMFAYSAIAAGHLLELEQLAKDVERSGLGYSAVLEAMNKFAQDHGGEIPVWFLVMALFQLTSWAACLAAAICGVLALRQSTRRPLAVAALVICGVFLVISCLGLLLS